MGVTCFDSEPDKWLGYQRRRDEFLPADDRFMWTIDTFNDQQSGYFFEMNPSGLMGDALRGAGFNNRQWDGIWNAQASGAARSAGRIEIEIPFRTLNFDPDSDSLGHQLPAHGAPQERREHLDGLGAQPGAEPHVERRPADRPRRRRARATASTSSRTSSARPSRFPGRGDSTVTNDARRRASTSSTARRRGCART